MTRDDSPEVAALFALPPDQFVAARDELAKRLRAEGDREGAKRVRTLRRPTVPAWAVDQLARLHPAELDALRAAGQRLRLAQQEALTGQGAAGLRAATAQRRDVIDRLVGHAAAVLTESGRDPAPHRAEIAATLEAASVDEEAAAAVRSGTLSHELTPPSTFGDLSAWAVPAAPVQTHPPEEPAEDLADRRAELTAALQEAQARADQADQAARDAEQAAETARRDAAAAAREVEGLEQLLAGARSRAEAADQRRQATDATADQAHQEAQQAADQLQRTQQLLQELGNQ